MQLGQFFARSLFFGRLLAIDRIFLKWPKELSQFGHNAFFRSQKIFGQTKKSDRRF